MKNALLSLAVALVMCLPTFAQDPQTPPIDDGDVVKITTSLIQLDATITDKKGNPIRDLRSDEVEIYENGKKQDISNFSFVPGTRDVADDAAARRAADPLLPPSTVRLENVRRTIAIVVDDLSLSFESSHPAKQAVKKFINEQMQPGDLVAIIRTGGGIGALQQFTTDKRQLLAAADKIRWNVNGASKVGAFGPISPSTAAQVDGPNGLSRRNDSEREFDAEVNEFHESVLVVGTLGALNFIVRGMDELPGRKSVIMFSDGLRLSNRDGRGRFRESIIMDSLRQLVDRANRSAVVVYTIDARGLVAGTGLNAEDNTFGISADDIESKLSERKNSLFDSQEGLRFLARQTGGIAMINQNNLSKGVAAALNDQSYYLIGYQPDGDAFDPKSRRFNKIEIKVKREGARVRYRSGFFGISDEKLVSPKRTGDQAIFHALTSPFAVNDVTLRLNAVFSSESSPVVRSYLHVDGTDLTFTKQPDGQYVTSFDLVAYGFGDNGVPVDQVSNNNTLTISEAGYEKVRKKGFVYAFNFPFKKPGAYQLRVAVRDTVSNKVGSSNQFIEVPNLKKGRLTLSGLVFENLPLEAWNKVLANPESYSEVKKTTDPVADTALRQFGPGTIVRFGFEIYNEKRNPTGQPSLTTQIRIFKDSQPIYEGVAEPLSVTNPHTSAINSTGSFRLGQDMEPGEYILQIIVTDKLAKEKRSVASQFIPFEITQ